MRAKTACRPLVLLGLGLFAALGTSMNTDAEAERIYRSAPAFAPLGDDNHIANGHHNLSSITIRSPTHLRGIQQVADANIHSKIARNNAICRKKRFCKIHQRAFVIAH
ncbi:hypothetical protein AB0L00_25075 [Actinoallomurus sp. NPDC052308]|uniref:hypothetical protein n=1 Tax=Actinoallomurus sp. NPDC052308 TaxID=3155530 RepID=UPI00342F2C72